VLHILWNICALIGVRTDYTSCLQLSRFVPLQAPAAPGWWGVVSPQPRALAQGPSGGGSGQPGPLRRGQGGRSAGEMPRASVPLSVAPGGNVLG